MPTSPTPIPFKAETRQLLDILAHSLYKEREIFLRELISNASDALTRMEFELLTNREVLDHDVPPAIRITPDEKEGTLTISDTGIGMTADELEENLGTIAHSGARAFAQAAKESGRPLTDLIGQFGVGFYSAFMVADEITVTARSYRPEAQAASWQSSGGDTFTIQPAERAERGASVTLKFKEDAKEFLQEHRLREIVRKHSDFIPYPIYIGASEEQANRQSALWRQNPRETEQKDYDEFYRQLTLDFEAPLTHAHMSVDAPVQMYALLFVPARAERNIFTLRKEDGLKLYARKVLIQEYCKDLLPEYFRFIQGVVDSEDLPLNVSRETVQANRLMLHLKKLVTGKVLDMLKKHAEDKTAYAAFWQQNGRYLKEGVAIEQTEPENLYPLLRFRTTTRPAEWVSLDDYIAAMKPDQPAIYYILGDDEKSAVHSPHLDLVRRYEYETLLFTDPIDAFMLARLNKYAEKPLVNAANADLKPLPASESDSSGTGAASVPEGNLPGLVDRLKAALGERVTDVRVTDRLVDSPARLVDPEGTPPQELQRVYRLLKEEFTAPKKVLEINPRHALLIRLDALPPDSALAGLIIEQLYENALLIEGLHPNPAAMIERIQQIMQSALERLS